MQEVLHLQQSHMPQLQIFARGAKFAMYKPAEEMVYIGLDEESRTKGKAAIDVVGAQTGKSIGSVLQQVVCWVLSSALRYRRLPNTSWLLDDCGAPCSSLERQAGSMLGHLQWWGGGLRSFKV